MEHPKRAGERGGEIKWHILQASQISWGSGVCNPHTKGLKFKELIIIVKRGSFIECSLPARPCAKSLTYLVSFNPLNNSNEK